MNWFKGLVPNTGTLSGSLVVLVGSLSAISASGRIDSGLQQPPYPAHTNNHLNSITTAGNFANPLMPAKDLPGRQELLIFAGAKGDLLAVPELGKPAKTPERQSTKNTPWRNKDTGKPSSGDAAPMPGYEKMDGENAENEARQKPDNSNEALPESEAKPKTVNANDELLDTVKGSAAKADDELLGEDATETETADSNDTLLENDPDAGKPKTSDELLANAPNDAAKADDELLDEGANETEAADGEDTLLENDPNAGKPKTSDELLANVPEDGDQSNDDLLDTGASEAETPEQKAEPEEDSKDKEKAISADEQHLNLFVENRYPSANTCGTCHPKHYKEWSVSQHAYAQLSPIYLSLNNKINKLSNGSNGDFCLRCHSPVGANLGESSFASNLDRHPASREGITCVVCHRINKAYNKASGRLALVEGGLTDPIFGPSGNAGLKKVLKQPDKYRVVTDPKDSGRKIHGESKLFESIKTPIFCGTCHDVTLFNGFRLEEAFSEYRVSPAAAKGITCQDCHMGKIQGKPSGYERGPAALVGDVPTAPRKLTSHLFSGPDYPVIHPGIFPHNQEAAAFKTMRQWLQFKHKEGWGTDKFENSVSDSYKFPEAWASVDDRYDAREILNKQFELLEFAKKKRLEVLKNGFILADVVTDRADRNGIAFRVKVSSGTDGHNVPTGFTGERLIWLEVTVTDRDGKVVFRSGDRDPNGDVRDGHSSYVHAGEIKQDPYLFSLQSIFVTQNGRGGEIEHVIPIPFPQFALPRVLPSTTSLVFTGEPATERNHKKGIEPNGHRWASYKVDSGSLTGKPPYKASIKLKAQAVPINLLTNIQDVGFDFNMTPQEVGRNLIAGTQVLGKKELEFDIPVSVAPSAASFQFEPQTEPRARKKLDPDTR